MKTNTDAICIGRDTFLTISIIRLVHKRRVREAKHRAFWSGLAAILKFWKK